MDGWKQCVVTGVTVLLVLVATQLPPVGSNATEARGQRPGGRDRSTGSTAIASLSSASIAAALASRQATAGSGNGGSSSSNSGNASNGAGNGNNGGEGKCNIAQLRCANGTCIPASKFCDGNFDCLDKSDEPKACTGKCALITSFFFIFLGSNLEKRKSRKRATAYLRVMSLKWGTPLHSF